MHSIPHTFTIVADAGLQDEANGDAAIEGKTEKATGARLGAARGRQGCPSTRELGLRVVLPAGLVLSPLRDADRIFLPDPRKLVRTRGSSRLYPLPFKLFSARTQHYLIESEIVEHQTPWIMTS